LKTEPAIAQTALVEILLREYALSVERLNFLPTEWTACCYAVHCTNNERYFLKLTTPGGFIPYAACDPDFYLPLTHELHARDILPYIAYSIPTRDGRFMLTVDGYCLILFNYIDGQVVGLGEMSEDILMRLAGLLGVLHRSAPLIKLDYVLRECYAIPFENDLLGALDRLRRVTTADRQGIQDLRDLLLPRQDTILELLRRLKELQAYAIKADKPQVCCHTDLHGNNLMLDAQSHLYILDWEGALLAPPEQDLAFFVWRDDFWQLFLPAYENEFGPAQLDSAIFGFYFYRRNLEDLADWVVRILHHNTTAEQDAEDLLGIQGDCISGWPYLEKNIQTIANHLGVFHR
jgi:Ser/Thr protein kinase RdoA (MazF antagonist)